MATAHNQNQNQNMSSNINKYLPLHKRAVTDLITPAAPPPVGVSTMSLAFERAKPKTKTTKTTTTK